MDNKDIVVASAITPMSMMQVALEKGIDSEQLSKLMDMSERYEANEARKAYMLAMSKFKANAPIITADKDVAYSGTAYSHASNANVTGSIIPRLAEHGLVHRWDQSQEGSAITITCIITHELGHSERTPMTASPDTSGSKNPIQAIASAITYMQRYTLLAATGLAVQDKNDDDGGAQAIAEHQLRQIGLYQAVIDNYESIQVIKLCFEEESWDEAYEAWAEISDDDKAKLWLAPTKYDRAAFTTKEIAVFKSNEWTAARHAFHGEK
tara:strand:+ start:1128 stop:1925 length:798 start_codon:yes stop_codon:yes gene_type:complete